MLSIAILGLLLITGAWYAHKTRKYIRDVYFAKHKDNEQSPGLTVDKNGRMTTDMKEFFRSKKVIDTIRKLPNIRKEE